MKKLIISVILVMAVLICAGLVGCGDKTETTGTTQATQTTQTSQSQTIPATTSTSAATQTTTTASGSDFWADMPVYPGASQIQKGNWSIPPADDSEYSKFEWRYYEVSASLEDISNFYNTEMKKKGWEIVAWMDMGQMSYGMFNKNNENDAAMVWINSEESKTVIATWRATK